MKLINNNHKELVSSQGVMPYGGISKETNVSVKFSYNPLYTTQTSSPAVMNTSWTFSINTSNSFISITSHLDVCSVSIFVSKLSWLENMHMCAVDGTNDSSGIALFFNASLSLVYHNSIEW